MSSGRKSLKNKDNSKDSDEEPEAILGDLDLESSSESNSESDHATTPIKYEDDDTGSEANQFVDPITKIEISDIGVDLGDNPPIDTLSQGRIKIEKESEEPKGQIKSKRSKKRGTGNFLCEDCDRRFLSNAILKKHVRNTHIKPILCPKEGCNKLSYSKYSLIVHKRFHEREAGQFPCPVPGCSKVYSTANSLGYHKRYKHNPHPEKLKPPPSRQKHPNRPFICGKCGRDFETSFGLNYHIKRTCSFRVKNDNPPKIYPCTIPNCERVFNTTSYRNVHIKLHKGIKDFQCEFCGVRYSLRCSLNRHRVRTHLDLLPKEDKEIYLKKLGKIRENCRKMRDKNGGKKKVLESEKRKFYYKRKSESHEEMMKRVAKNEAWRIRYANVSPEKKAARLERYRRYNQKRKAIKKGKKSETNQGTQTGHEEEINHFEMEVNLDDSGNDLKTSLDQIYLKVEKEHEGSKFRKSHVQTGIKTKEFKCEDCNVQYARICQLRRHLRSHLPMPCQFEGCSNVSYTKNNYYSHRKSHIQKVGPKGELLYACTVPGCSKVYNLPNSLKNHKLLKHHPNPEKLKPTPDRVKYPDRPFMCDKCGRNYESRAALKIHLKLVCTNSSTFPCSFQGCKREYRSKAAYNRHMKIHNGILDCICDICGAGFVTNDILRKHRLRHEKNSLPPQDWEKNKKILAKRRAKAAKRLVGAKKNNTTKKK